LTKSCPKQHVFMTNAYHNWDRLKENLYSTRGNSSKRDIGKSYAETQSNFVPANFMNLNSHQCSKLKLIFPIQISPTSKGLSNVYPAPKKLSENNYLFINTESWKQTSSTKKGQGLATCIIPTNYCSDLFFHAIEPSSTMWTS
jgi:hypothetical protein